MSLVAGGAILREGLECFRALLAGNRGRFQGRLKCLGVFGRSLQALLVVGVALGGERPALALHFAWDWVALASPDGESLPVRRSLLAIAVMLGGFLAYGRIVVEGARLSKVRFAPSSARSLWGWPFR